MKISRLDEITRNYVGISTQKRVDEQILFVLQDISSTLAMIYDRIENEGSDATLIELNDLHSHHGETLYFDSIELEEGYEAVLKCEIANKKSNVDIRLTAFGGDMDMPISEYGKTWRLWVGTPSEKQRRDEPWKK